MEFFKNELYLMELLEGTVFAQGRCATRLRYAPTGETLNYPTTPGRSRQPGSSAAHSPFQNERRRPPAPNRKDDVMRGSLLAALCLLALLDCAPGDPTASSIPGEVLDLHVGFDGGEGSPGAVAVVVWQSAGANVVYDVVTGTLGDLRGDGGIASAVCTGDNLASTWMEDPTPDPISGTGSYFLVRAHNSCGDGPYAGAGSGTPQSGCP